MARRSTWLVIGLLALVLAAGVGGWWLGRGSGQPEATALPAAPASPYHASDPALVAATGRPQLVEFYHRL